MNYVQGRLLCQIRVGGGCVRVKGTVSNTLKGGGTEKREGETKILKSEGKLGQGVSRCLKNGGLESPYKLCNWEYARENILANICFNF